MAFVGLFWHCSCGERLPTNLASIALRMAEDDKEDDDIRQSSCRCSSKCFCGMFLLLATVGCGFAVWYIGPTYLLRSFLNALPKKPGLRWYLIFGSVTVVCIVILLPIWPPLCMASGLIFGLYYGAALNFVVIVSAAIISITIGRYFLQEPVRQWLASGEYPHVTRALLILEDDENSLRFQILFRFLFIPMAFRNYGPSTLHIPLWKLYLGTLPHSAWISVLFASLGATFRDTAELVRDGKEVTFKSFKWQQVAVLIASATVSILLAVFATHKYRERIEGDDAAIALAGAGEARGGGHGLTSVETDARVMRD